MRRVVILGSTGSIGVQALNIIRDSMSSDMPLRVVGVSADTKWQDALAQASSFDVSNVFIADAAASATARDAAGGAGNSIHVCGSVGELLDRTEPDLVLNAVVGFAGLENTLAALERGIHVALANKESLVAAGSLCLETAERNDALIIPVDSEHSAMMQCLSGSNPDEVDSLILTASGGPFRGKSLAELQNVTLTDALNHPTWNMGGKITIDSATLMNKGLELIEAMVLFDVQEHQVETVIHEHSIVHALVRHNDGSLLAHLGWPDMHIPIAWALHYPDRPHVARARHLDLTSMPALEFTQPDLDTFRCLKLARQAAIIGGGAPCVLNASNEVAVRKFMDGEIKFVEIPDLVENALNTFGDAPNPTSIDQAKELDSKARAI